MPSNFRRLDIPDVVLVEPKRFCDDRGFFAEMYKQTEFAANGIDCDFVQVNQSNSKKNVVRGLHYQLNPRPQAKLVQAVSGEIFDVAVDLRRGSPWFGQWVGVHLSAERFNMLFIPAGFAHGFSVLSETADVIYYCSDVYAPETERGLVWNDSKINIDWKVKNPIVSPKDLALPAFDQIENNHVYKQ